MKTPICVFFLLTFALVVFAHTQDDALTLQREGDHQKAITICLTLLKTEPRNLELYVVLARSLIATQQYQEAIQWVKKGRGLSQYDPRLIESQAIALYQLGQNRESLYLFEDYIAYIPNGIKLAEVYYYIGEIYLRMGKYRHADIAFSAAVQLQGLNNVWWTRLGYSREQAKEYQSALEAYSVALKLNKNAKDAQKGYERVLKHF
ncbi:MAG: tetratricopeptide repeat protein [Treponema sp.]